MTPSKPIPDELLEYFECDPDTGRITRKRDSGYAKCGAEVKPRPLRYGAGRRVRYPELRFRHIDYQLHRVVWFLCTREQPPAMLDHKDGDPLNNSFSNLRPANAGQNGANKRGKRALPKGVRPVGSRYGAYIKLEYRSMRLGTFDTIEQASAAYMAAATARYGEYARAR